MHVVWTILLTSLIVYAFSVVAYIIYETSLSVLEGKANSKFRTVLASKIKEGMIWPLLPVFKQEKRIKP